MKDERWKLICEGLGLNYDEIVADMPVEPTTTTASHEGDDTDTSTEDKPQRIAAVDCKEIEDKRARDNLFLLAMYAEGRLAKDIEDGMKVDPMKLWGILDALRAIKETSMETTIWS